MNKLAIIEKTFIRFGALNSSAAKQVQRWEIESWLDEGLSRVGRIVASGQNFRTLQKTITCQLGHYDKPITFDLMQSFSAEGGWGTGVTINADGSVQGVIDSFVFANFAITMDVGEECHKSQYLEFTWQSEINEPVSLAFWPVSQPVDALKPGVQIDAQPEILFAVTVEQSAAAPSTLAAWAGGNPVLNPDLTAPVAKGDRVRVQFSATGQVIVQLFAGTTSVLKGNYPLVTFDDETTALKIFQNFIPVLLFHELNAKVSKVCVGVFDPTVAALPDRVIVDSIRTRGGVAFEDGKPMGYVADGHLTGLPRIKNHWHWTDENRQVRVFPSPMIQRTYKTGSAIWRYDKPRRAWVSLASLPPGATLSTPTPIIVEYDADGLRLAANGDYTVNTAKEEIILILPAQPSDGTLVRIAEASSTWGTHPVSVRASGSDMLLDLAQSERRVCVTVNAIPTIEELPFELEEILINALLEIGMERKQNPALKQKANQIPPKIPTTANDAQPNAV